MAEFIEEWMDFENEILYKNRFFCRHNMLNHIKQLAEYQYEVLPESTILYRARIIPKSDIKKDARTILGDKVFIDDVDERCKLYDELSIFGYDEIHSGIPPIEKTQNGRTNPQYIPYLYLAKHPYTAIAECKPYQFNNISIADYLTLEPLKLMCFNHSVNNPGMECSYTEELINHLFYIFSRPVKEINKDYLVTQYITEYIKNLNFDGVCYRSSLHKKGENITIFNDEVCKFIKSYVYHIDDIIIKTKPDINNYKAPDITPDEYKKYNL